MKYMVALVLGLSLLGMTQAHASLLSTDSWEVNNVAGNNDLATSGWSLGGSVDTALADQLMSDGYTYYGSTGSSPVNGIDFFNGASMQNSFITKHVYKQNNEYHS